MRKLYKNLIIITIVVAVVPLCLAMVNSDNLVVTSYEVSHENIPVSFDGFKIVQISDYHNKAIEYGNVSIIDAIVEEDPDIIVITGDFIDEYMKDLSRIELLLNGLSAYPIYYENGNHDIRSEFYDEFLTMIDDMGIENVSGRKLTIERGVDAISLIGVEQTLVDDKWGLHNEPNAIGGHITPLIADNFTVLLSHHPNFYQEASDIGVDLMLSGHFHGGHIRVFDWTPLGWLDPYYGGGHFDISGMDLVVSKGAGNGFIPLRIGCEAEIVVITLNATA